MRATVCCASESSVKRFETQGVCSKSRGDLCECTWIERCGEHKRKLLLQTSVRAAAAGRRAPTRRLQKNIINSLCFTKSENPRPHVSLNHSLSPSLAAPPRRSRRPKLVVVGCGTHKRRTAPLKKQTAKHAPPKNFRSSSSSSRNWESEKQKLALNGSLSSNNKHHLASKRRRKLRRISRGRRGEADTQRRRATPPTNQQRQRSPAKQVLLAPRHRSSTTMRARPLLSSSSCSSALSLSSTPRPARPWQRPPCARAGCTAAASSGRRRGRSAARSRAAA